MNTNEEAKSSCSTGFCYRLTRGDQTPWDICIDDDDDLRVTIYEADHLVNYGETLMQVWSDEQDGEGLLAADRSSIADMWKAFDEK